LRIARSSARLEPHARDAAADQVQPVEVLLDAAGLADHHGVGCQRSGPGDVTGAERGAVLLVGREQQAEAPGRRRVLGETSRGGEHRGQRTLHVC
jgi:hypothetical protein